MSNDEEVHNMLISHIEEHAAEIIPELLQAGEITIESLPGATLIEKLHLYTDEDVRNRIYRAGILAQHKLLIDIIEARFPNLTELAQQQVVRLNKYQQLRQLARLMATAPDEATARWVLTAFDPVGGVWPAPPRAR